MFRLALSFILALSCLTLSAQTAAIQSFDEEPVTQEQETEKDNTTSDYRSKRFSFSIYAGAQVDGPKRQVHDLFQDYNLGGRVTEHRGFGNVHHTKYPISSSIVHYHLSSRYRINRTLSAGLEFGMMIAGQTIGLPISRDEPGFRLRYRMHSTSLLGSVHDNDDVLMLTAGPVLSASHIYRNDGKATVADHYRKYLLGIDFMISLNIVKTKTIKWGISLLHRFSPPVQIGPFYADESRSAIIFDKEKIRMSHTSIGFLFTYNFGRQLEN